MFSLPLYILSASLLWTLPSVAGPLLWSDPSLCQCVLISVQEQTCLAQVDGGYYRTSWGKAYWERVSDTEAYFHPATESPAAVFHGITLAQASESLDQSMGKDEMFEALSAALLYTPQISLGYLDGLLRHPDAAAELRHARERFYAHPPKLSDLFSAIAVCESNRLKGAADLFELLRRDLVRMEKVREAFNRIPERDFERAAVSKQAFERMAAYSGLFFRVAHAEKHSSGRQILRLLPPTNPFQILHRPEQVVDAWMDELHF